MKRFQGIAFSDVKIYCGACIKRGHSWNWIESPEIDPTWIYQNMWKFDLCLDLHIGGKRIAYLINYGGIIDYPYGKNEIGS